MQLIEHKQQMCPGTSLEILKLYTCMYKHVGDMHIHYALQDAATRFPFVSAALLTKCSLK